MKPSAPPKTYRVKSFGCQMNVYDGQRMADVLGEEGYVETATRVMTPIRHPAEYLPHPRKARGAQGLYRARQAARPEARAQSAGTRDPLLVVAGCVAQAEGAEIHAPPTGRRPRHRPADLSPPARHCWRRRARAVASSTPTLPPEDKFDHLPAREARGDPRPPSRPSSPCRKAATSSALICVVPYTRGAEFSRPVAQVIAEVETVGAGRRAGRSRCSART
jgi:tRNA-2-methylthio-N6-dimethylallyladenosine synthase